MGKFFFVSETGNRIVAGDDIPWGESVDLISRTNLNNLIATQDLKYSFLQGPRNAYKCSTFFIQVLKSFETMEFFEEKAFL